MHTRIRNPCSRQISLIITSIYQLIIWVIIFVFIWFRFWDQYAPLSWSRFFALCVCVCVCVRFQKTSILCEPATTATYGEFGSIWFSSAGLMMGRTVPQAIRHRANSYQLYVTILEQQTKNWFRSLLFFVCPIINSVKLIIIYQAKNKQKCTHTFTSSSTYLLCQDPQIQAQNTTSNQISIFSIERTINQNILKEFGAWLA